MKFMLDTNIIAYAKNHRPESVLRRFMQYRPCAIVTVLIVTPFFDFLPRQVGL